MKQRGVISVLIGVFMIVVIVVMAMQSRREGLEAHKSQDIAAMDAAMEKLNAAWQADSQDIYQATQQAQQEGADATDQGASNGNENTGDDVTDVEFEEVDDSK